MMLAKAFLGLVILGLASADGGLLETSLTPSEEVTDDDRHSMAVDYANQQFQIRQDERNAIRAAAAANDASTGISLYTGAHQQLNGLPDDLVDTVEMANYYNDYIYHFTEGLSDNDRRSIMELNSLKIELPFWNGTSPPAYPDCSLCDASSTIRTYNGSCNNLQYCMQGARSKAFKRLLPPDYVGFGEPRLSDTDTRMESSPMHIARNKFSRATNSSDRITSPNFLTQLFMLWGQWIAHDILGTPADTVFTETGSPINIDCTLLDNEDEYSECFSILFRRSMKYNFVRSAAGLVDKDGEYRFGHREQMNTMSAYIDASHVYGSTAEQAADLYDSTTGYLLFRDNITGGIQKDGDGNVFKEQVLPTSIGQYCENRNETVHGECFVAGDGRANVFLGTTMAHIMHTREHRHIVDEIKKIKPDVSGEDAYQMARKVIIAYNEKITYVDYLPLLLGEEMFERYGLDPTIGTTYDANEDATISNSFAASSFRASHSSIYERVRMARRDGTLSAKAGIMGTMFDPSRFYRSNGFTVMRRYMMGLALDVCDAIDTTFARSMITSLFRSKTSDEPAHLRRGTALPAINIQRGRDHGLPTCGAFMDMISEQTGDTIENIDDPDTRAKDFYYCGLEETPIEGGELGPMFAHITAAQFKDIMIADRFFYSHTNAVPQMFTSEQRAEIEKVTMSQLLCRHIIAVKDTVVNRGRDWRDIKLTEDTFRAPNDETNPLKNCNEILAGDLPDIATILGLTPTS